MALRTLPPELARLVKSFLTLDDIIVLVGCVRACAKTHGLYQFLPAQDELDAHVPDSAWCLRTDRRRRTMTCGPPGLRQQREAASSADTSCGDRTSCVYHNDSLRSLLVRNADYSTITRSKMDAIEAIGHLCGAMQDLGSRQRIAIEILEMQQRRRQLNRFALGRTLVAALRLSLGDVVGWIRRARLGSVPPRFRVDVMLACCEYDGVDVGYDIVMEMIQHEVPSIQTLQAVLASAARHGRVQIIRLVLDILATMSSLTSQLLHEGLSAAAGGGHRDAMDVILSAADTRNVKLDATDALACASRENQIHVVEYILELSTVTVKYSMPASPSSPLAAAVEGGNPQLVTAILADQRVNSWNPLALQRAVSDGNVSIMKQLLSHEHCRPKDVDIALRSLGRSKAQSEIVYELVKHHSGRPVDIWELVEVVCSHGHVQVIEHVLSTIVSDNGDSNNRKYWRPLVTAARNGHTEVVQRILDGSGVWQPLSMEKSLDSVAELAEALLAACHRDHLPVAQQLICSVGLDMIQLLRIVEAAAAAPTSSVLRWLISTQDSIMSQCDLDAALQYACAHGRVDAVRLLLQHERVRFADGLAIQFAATSGRADLVTLLLADPRVTHRYDLESALIDASREGHTAVVALLLADTRLEITSGAAFHEAADRGHLDVLKLLLSAPAMWVNPELLDLQVAFTRAARRGHYAVVFMLLNDLRVPLPRNGAVTRVEDLPKRAGDAAWCRVLRRYLRHPRVDPAADDNQLLLDACLHAKRGVVDALLRCGRVTVDATVLEAVNDLVGLSSAATSGGMQRERARRYALLAQDLRQHLKSVVAPS